MAGIGFVLRKLTQRDDLLGVDDVALEQDRAADA